MSQNDDSFVSFEIKKEGPMKDLKVLGIDLAKNIFQLHGIDSKGKVLFRKRVKRENLAQFIINLPLCLIGMEACASAHYWARRFQAMGHEIKLMSPQFVKPYVKTNKNDFNDAEAIAEAVTRPNMRFVPIKIIEQQKTLTIRGNKIVLLGISKRGDRYLRELLIHGGRAVVRTCEGRDDTRHQWVKKKKDVAGYNKAAVAVANKNARIIWALLARDEEYRKSA
jgi:transposase